MDRKIHLVDALRSVISDEPVSQHLSSFKLLGLPHRQLEHFSKKKMLPLQL